MNKNKTSKKKKADKGMMLIHAGTVLSCRLTANTNKTALHVFFSAQATKGESPDQVIPIKSKSPVDMFCPSVEGTVIWCKLESGKEQYYDTRTGEHLTTEKLKARNKVEQINFYA